MTALQGLDRPGLPGASAQFNHFIAQVRLFIRDFPELNRLVAGTESHDRMIAFAVCDALSDFNATPPLIGAYGFDYFAEQGWLHPLKLKTVAVLLESVGILQTRNHLPFSDGGLNVSTSDKTPLLQSWIQLFDGRWENWKRQVKMSLNIGQLLGQASGIPSEMSYINGFWDLTSEV